MNLAKEHIKIEFPDLYQLTCHDEFPWKSINKSFNSKHKERFKKIKSDYEKINISITLFDLIIAKKAGQKEILGIYSYLNSLFKELNQNLNNEEKKIITPILKNLLNQLDRYFLNYVGELSVVNNLKKSKLFELIGNEILLKNNKSIDFQVLTKDSKSKLLIEIMNINPDENKFFKKKPDIKKFLRKRLEDKLIDKFKALKNPPYVQVIPIIWGSVRLIKEFSFFFQSNNLEKEGIFEPLAYITRTNNIGYYEHKFSLISDLKF